MKKVFIIVILLMPVYLYSQTIRVSTAKSRDSLSVQVNNVHEYGLGEDTLNTNDNWIKTQGIKYPDGTTQNSFDTINIDDVSSDIQSVTFDSLKSVKIRLDEIESLNNDSIIIKDDVTIDSSLTVSGAINLNPILETFSVSKTITFENNSIWRDIEITNDMTINIEGIEYGTFYFLNIFQDGTGRTVTKGAGWGTLVDGGKAISTTANSESTIQFWRTVQGNIRHAIITVNE